MTPEIIFENKDFLVINKPAGLVVHSDGKTKEATLVDWVIENYPEMENVGEPLILANGEVIKRSGIVHRLDRETSGAMILAKTQESFDFFKKAFKDRDIEKTYNAFVFGSVKNDLGTIDAPIARSRSDFRKWSAQRGARGQERMAITEYKVLERFEESGQKFSFLELMPKTGRTHQIRVHMKYLNHPIVGDSLYGGKVWQGLGFDRVALHSRKISFANLQGEVREFEAPYPQDFLDVIVGL
ncbi:MAG: RluA family pseudouridine synthase [Bacteroidetes bacterium]|nr:RluA family pseudouridine synthase [Bacteroidota bacterium]